MDQTPPMTLGMIHQRFMAIEHNMVAQVERFENAFQRITDQSANSGGAGSSGSTVTGNSKATGTAHVEVPLVNMVNNPLYNVIFQPSATDTPYNGHLMILGTPWWQHMPYQGYQVPWPTSPKTQHSGTATGSNVARNAPATNQSQLQNTAFQHQTPPVQDQQGSKMVLPQVTEQESVPRITYGPQGTSGPGLQGLTGAGTNQGPTGVGINQGPAIETSE
ncbi:OLC1v1015619C1 [Oldenlandia corymbosa var. corymbosa]|uniref:OLC1v1015619C1 n=1 Tax=Oldenlandia corymbosa var. corymbosa TaxID=529605 RepID=A0AAV1E6S8_OLDCO|nr:OLC1v1015619C1 [Oldenlandia corymbosa var. corymbosa]